MKKNTLCQNTPRILHLVPGFRSGGIESLLMSLYRCLDKETLQFDFMVDTCDHLPEFDEIRAAGGRVFQMGRYLNSPIKYQIKLNSILRKYGHEYVSLHSHTITRALPVLWAARQHNISQRILHAHTDSLQDTKWATISPFIVKATALLATDYWACSEAAGRFFFNLRDYKVFNNVIQTQRFLFNLDDRFRIRELLSIGQNDFIIGHTGRFTYEKNHTLLVQIFAELHRLQPNAKLLLVGDGPLKSEIQDLVEGLGLKEVVFFAGLQSDIASYLSAMDIFLLPSHFEGFCISLLEAQANGLPCLASDVIPEEVQMTSSVITCASGAPVSKYVKILIKLYNVGRADSASNIAIIKQAGYDSELQLSTILDMYNV